MADIFTKAKRSDVMSKVGHVKTAPERKVALMLKTFRVRFQQNVSRMPGQPDFVLPGAKTIIFVHGCFWHRHKGCKRATTPSTNVKFWLTKFDGNVRRDRKNARLLRREGWRVITVWECCLAKPARVLAHLSRALRPDRECRRMTKAEEAEWKRKVAAAERRLQSSATKHGPRALHAAKMNGGAVAGGGGQLQRRTSAGEAPLRRGHGRRTCRF